MLDHKMNSIWCVNHFNPILLSSRAPLLQDVPPDLVDHDPHEGIEHTHVDQDNILNDHVSAEKDVSEGDTDDADTT